MIKCYKIGWFVGRPSQYIIFVYVVYDWCASRCRQYRHTTMALWKITPFYEWFPNADLHPCINMPKEVWRSDHLENSLPHINIRHWHLRKSSCSSIKIINENARVNVIGIIGYLVNQSLISWTWGRRRDGRPNKSRWVLWKFLHPWVFELHPTLLCGATSNCRQACPSVRPP